MYPAAPDSRLEYHRAVSPTLLSPCPIVDGSAFPSLLSQYETRTGSPGVTGTRSVIATASGASSVFCSMSRLEVPVCASAVVRVRKNGWVSGQPSAPVPASGLKKYHPPGTSTVALKMSPGQTPSVPVRTKKSST